MRSCLIAFFVVIEPPIYRLFSYTEVFSVLKTVRWIEVLKS